MQHIKDKVLIIGPGDLGWELSQQLTNLCWETEFIDRHTGRNQQAVIDAIRGNDVVCITIPTLRGGQVAYGYIQQALDQAKPVIIAEKSALANYPEELAQYRDKMGISATVGGGSGILSLLTGSYPKVDSAWGVINGSLNFLMNGIARGHSFKSIYAIGSAQKIFERGSTNLATVVATEITDVAYKLTIMANLLGEKTFLKLSDLEVIAPSFEYLKNILVPNTPWRFAISIYSERSRIPMEKYAFVRGQLGKYKIRGGFVDKTKPSPMVYWPQAQGNCLSVRYCEGEDGFRAGVGAGPVETAEAMVKDINYQMEGRFAQV